jgi:hypothetical protein
MDLDNRMSGRSAASLSRLVAQWCPAIVILGLLIVPLTTLFPFALQVQDDIPDQIRRGFHFRTNPLDVVANLLLFMPLGFGLAGLLANTKRWQKSTRLVLVLLISVLLSASVELLQVFLPTRAATVTDIVVNGTGGVLGAMCFHHWGFELLSFASLLLERGQKLLLRLSMKHLVAIFLSYMLVAFAMVNLIQTTTLQNWDDSYPLIVGNWFPQNLPWEGTIGDIQIADRAVSRQEARAILSGATQLPTEGGSLVAAYPMTGNGNFADQTGNLPDLVWHNRRSGESAAPTGANQGAHLHSQQWLQTEGSTAPVLQRLQRGSQFTLMATIAPASIERDQTGFTTFLGFSNASGNYNFRLGQIGQFLTLWIRTTLNSDFNIPPDAAIAVLKDTTPQRILVTYSGMVLRIYTSHSDQELAFNISGANFRVVTLGLIFAPLGFLLALITLRLKGRLPVWLALTCSGVILPPLLLEGLIAASTNRKISLANCLLGVLVMGSILLIVRAASRFSPSQA